MLTKRELLSYDGILLAFSGGKDSIACYTKLIDMGVPPSKIQVHHHEIDGGPGAKSFMDWPCTPAYCEAFAKEFGLQYYPSWKVDGFYGEMMRDNELTKPTAFYTHEGELVTTGGCHGSKNTRKKFPQVTASLMTRWCSAYLKIMVMDSLINNQERFTRGKWLVVTGERAQESAARAKYEVFEPHRADRRDGKKVKRYIDHWRPVHDWKEEQVWEAMERHHILPHPAYRLGWGRLSCMTCIFGSPNQWASVKKIDPARFELMAKLEQDFGCTIHRTKNLYERVENAKPYEDMDPNLVIAALTPAYDQSIITLNWELPKGAFGESAGPT